jgi:hypothetical protein
LYCQKSTRYHFTPNSARNGREKIITKKAQEANTNVGRQEKRNSKCEGKGETN